MSSYYRALYLRNNVRQDIYKVQELVLWFWGQLIILPSTQEDNQISRTLVFWDHAAAEIPT